MQTKFNTPWEYRYSTSEAFVDRAISQYSDSAGFALSSLRQLMDRMDRYQARRSKMQIALQLISLRAKRGILKTGGRGA